MSNYFSAARAWLASITPDLPPALLIVFVFVSVYSLRRWFPSAWVKFEHAVPFVDTIDPGPGIKVLLKFWQAIPGAVLAAVGGALFAGTSVKLAVWAVVSTAVAAAAHEIGADYATLRSASQLRAQAPMRKPAGRPPTLPTIGFLGMLALALSLAACGVLTSATSALWPPINHCLPASSELLAQVEDILLAGGDYESELERLATSDTKEVVGCTLKEAANDLSAPRGKFTPKAASAAAARARAFLAKKGLAQQ